MPDACVKLVYCSRSLLGTPEESPAALRDLLAVARAKNARKGITGALLVTSRYLAQTLEGSAELVEPLFERIRRDPRHHDVVLLMKTPLAERAFSNWSMALSYAEMERNTQEAVFERCFTTSGEDGAPAVEALIETGIAAVQLW